MSINEDQALPAYLLNHVLMDNVKMMPSRYKRASVRSGILYTQAYIRNIVDQKWPNMSRFLKTEIL